MYHGWVCVHLSLRKGEQSSKALIERGLSWFSETRETPKLPGMRSSVTQIFFIDSAGDVKTIEKLTELVDHLL